MATFPHGEIWAVNLVHIKIAGKWMFIPLKIVFIGIDPHPYPVVVWFRSPGSPVISRPHRPRRATWRRCFFESRTEPEGRGGRRKRAWAHPGTLTEHIKKKTMDSRDLEFIEFLDLEFLDLEFLDLAESQTRLRSIE